jgi:D-glycero-D-manno-heptose 1,7-bisphosphate phosphatase
MRPRPALFLDRDGVIVEEVEYLDHPSQLALIPGAAAAIARANAAEIPVVVVTNQAGIARGYFSEARVDDVHRHLSRLLECEGASIDRYFYCPHHPTAGQVPYRLECGCRKPRPGMLLRAAWELGLDLGRSFLVGDKLSDVQAGAVCRQAFLVRTGYGMAEAARLEEHGMGHVTILDDLGAAIDCCLPRLRQLLREED